VGVVVLGQTPSWMHSFTAWPALAVAWWLTFFSPWDLWHGRAMRNKAAVFLAAFGRAVSASHAITSWGADKVCTCPSVEQRLEMVGDTRRTYIASCVSFSVSIVCAGPPPRYLFELETKHFG